MPGASRAAISNGQDIVVRGYLKPISTLRRPLVSVSFATREPTKAAYERSDVCVVPAAGVAAEAMVALVIAKLALEKFGGDSAGELCRNYRGYLDQVRQFLSFCQSGGPKAGFVPCRRAATSENAGERSLR